jgi:hypothetical protein
MMLQVETHGERMTTTATGLDVDGVPAHAILRKVSEAGYVGGQGDMIIDLAISQLRPPGQGGSPRSGEP